MLTTYLKNKSFCPPCIEDAPNPDLGIIVVIPCYDEPDLLNSLESLLQCDPPECNAEVIVVINDSETTNGTIKKQNEATFQAAKSWAAKHQSEQLKFHILYKSNLPKKKAGVGLARKIGMDEAAYRFELIHHTRGIIVGFDADATVAQNYFQAIEHHYNEHADIQACGIRYEHPLEGSDFDADIYFSIIQYELHLRYFVAAKQYAGYPHAFDTIGSSMAVRADAYQAQGGMNTRKAGEDFYFLNKFIILGKFNELNSTRVIPSPRVSHRVPFGTGKAVGDLVEQQEILTTYHYQSFLDLKLCFEKINAFYTTTSLEQIELPVSVYQFLLKMNAEDAIEEIRNNTADFEAFKKRFFRWFDPFLLMKFVHFARDQYYPNVPVLEAGNWILNNYFAEEEQDSEKAVLETLRKCLNN